MSFAEELCIRGDFIVRGDTPRIAGASRHVIVCQQTQGVIQTEKERHSCARLAQVESLMRYLSTFIGHADDCIPSYLDTVKALPTPTQVLRHLSCSWCA